MLMFLLGVVFPFVVFGLWRLAKLIIGYLAVSDFINTSNKNTELSDQETNIRDTVESAYIIIPLYPVQNTNNLKCKVKVNLKPGMINEIFNSLEFNISRVQVYIMFGSICLNNIISMIFVHLKAKWAIRKMMKQLNSK